jgi:hypothetical protein
VTPLKVYIGYDPREAVTWHVLAHSILARSTGPVQICPISLANLKDIYTRPRNPAQSTDFTFARFLTPWLAGPGVSIFLDSDMLCLCDIWDLQKFALANPYSDVLCVKHDYSPKDGQKFLGNANSTYPCKNWSSLMIFNGHRQPVRRLTPEYVNKASPMDLHQFKWAEDVGEIPAEYNWLVGEYSFNPSAKIVHYTLGSPCFRAYQNCDYSDLWFEELGRMTHCDDPILEIVQNANVSRHGNANPNGFAESHDVQRPSEAGDPVGNPPASA